jgi:hypothetical protein
MVTLLVGLLAFYGYQSFQGLANGKVLGRYGYISRRENVITFWILFPIYVGGALFLAIFLPVFLLAFGVR